MRDGDPCPDCQWTTYLLSGRPILFLRCDACKNWFHCNVRIVKKGASVAGPAWQLEASINYECTKDLLNSMLRCDCLAQQIFLSHVAHCDLCASFSIPARKKGEYPPSEQRAKHVIRVLPQHTLHAFIMRLSKEDYRKSSLPAYTLQRRCGAVTAYLDRYLARVATVKQNGRAVDYRKKRLEVRDGKREN
jgi:hypothetical protein